MQLKIHIIFGDQRNQKLHIGSTYYQLILKQKKNYFPIKTNYIIIQQNGIFSSYIKEKGKSRKQNQSTDVGDKVLDFHSMKIKLMQEEHNAKMLLIDRQKKIMEEEHNLRMEILRKWEESAKNCQSFSHSSHKISDIILNNFVDMGNMFYGNDPF